MDDLETPVEQTPEPIAPEVVPEPTPDPAPEPTPEPELPEPDPEDFAWLNEPTRPQEPPQQYMQQPHYPQPPPQQQPPQQPQQQGQFNLDQFVQDPNYLDRHVNQRMLQSVGPVANAVMQQQQQMQQFMSSQAQAGEMQLRGSLQHAQKEVYNKANSYRANPGVKNRVQDHLRERHAAAIDSAKRGDFAELHMMQSPKYHGAVLKLAEFLEGYQEASAPGPVGQAVVETPRTQVAPEPDIDIPADLVEAASRMGQGALERLKESWKNNQDMIEFS